MIRLRRFRGNPIIQPILEHHWEAKAAFNPGAILLDNRVHIIYRAMSNDDTSTVGYASSKDGLRIFERLPEPIYVPRADFEKKSQPGNSGCEDARMVQFGDRIYMTYTGYNARDNTRVAITSISVKDFINKKWDWTMPKAISDPKFYDKNSCIFPERVNGKIAIFHRIEPNIWLDFVDDLEFNNGKFIGGKPVMRARSDNWDDRKIGIAGPPIKTKIGWVLIYHGLSNLDLRYRLGAMLLDTEDPTRVLCRLRYPLIEPIDWYENEGLRAGTIFSCGGVVMKKRLFIYYGGADKYCAVAVLDWKELLDELKGKSN